MFDIIVIGKLGMWKHSQVSLNVIRLLMESGYMVQFDSGIQSSLVQ